MRTGVREYRRRKPVPAAIILAILVVTAGVVWVKLFSHTEDVDQRVSCSAASGTGANAGPLPYDGLASVPPAPANAVPVRVLNAGNQRGLAGRVVLQLDQFGFNQATSGGNDPAYPKGNMACLGQIRFGANGMAAARTLSLAVPCTQLVRDNRQDDSVDLSLGTGFTQLSPNSAALTALRQLAQWAQTHPKPPGGLQNRAAQVPGTDPNLLAEAHTTSC